MRMGLPSYLHHGSKISSSGYVPAYTCWFTFSVFYFWNDVWRGKLSVLISEQCLESLCNTGLREKWTLRCANERWFLTIYIATYLCRYQYFQRHQAHYRSWYTRKDFLLILHIKRRVPIFIHFFKISNWKKRILVILLIKGITHMLHCISQEYIGFILLIQKELPHYTAY